MFEPPSYVVSLLIGCLRRHGAPWLAHRWPLSMICWKWRQLTTPHGDHLWLVRSRLSIAMHWLVGQNPDLNSSDWLRIAQGSWHLSASLCAPSRILCHRISYLFLLFSRMTLSCRLVCEIHPSCLLSGSVVTSLFHVVFLFMFRSTKCFFIQRFCEHVYNFPLKILTTSSHHLYHQILIKQNNFKTWDL